MLYCPQVVKVRESRVMKTHVTTRAERLTTIEKMLFRSPAGMRVVEIAKACDVDRRTIYRDLALLEEIGVPVYQKDGRFFLNRDYYLATMRLNSHEAVTVLLAVRILSHLQDQENPYLVSLLRKLADILPTLPSEHTLTVAKRMAWANPVDRGYVAVLETVIRGWCERRAVKLWDGKNIYEFATYLLEPSPSGSIYLVGRDLISHKLYALKLRRIKRAALLKAPYDVPPHFNVQRYLVEPSGASALHELEDSSSDETEAVHNHHVELTVSEAIVELLKRDRTVRDADGHVQRFNETRYLLRLKIADWQTILPWVRSWGPLVEVVSPPELRKQLAEDAAQLSAVYSL